MKSDSVRPRWKIENGLHWQLDVSFRKNPARNREVNGPKNIAILRCRALDIDRRGISEGSLSIELGSELIQRLVADHFSDSFLASWGVE